MEFSQDVLAHRDLCLDMEYLATESYNRFVFDDQADARRVQACLFDAGVSDLSPPHGTVLLMGGEAMGVDSGFGWQRFAELRAGAAVALARAGMLRFDDATMERMKLADQVLLKPSQGDYYASRCAVRPDCQAGGLAVFLTRRRVDEATQQGYRRYVGEIESSVKPMLRICLEGLGFEQIGVKRADDPITGRSLEMVHVVRNLH